MGGDGDGYLGPTSGSEKWMYIYWIVCIICMYVCKYGMYGMDVCILNIHCRSMTLMISIPISVFNMSGSWRW